MIEQYPKKTSAITFLLIGIFLSLTCMGIVYFFINFSQKPALSAGKTSTPSGTFIPESSSLPEKNITFRDDVRTLLEQDLIGPLDESALLYTVERRTAVPTSPDDTQPFMDAIPGIITLLSSKGIAESDAAILANQWTVEEQAYRQLLEQNNIIGREQRVILEVFYGGQYRSATEKDSLIERQVFLDAASNVWIRTPESTRQLTQNANTPRGCTSGKILSYANPSLSPDGKYVVMTVHCDNDPAEIYVKDTTTLEAQFVTKGQTAIFQGNSSTLLIDNSLVMTNPLLMISL